MSTVKRFSMAMAVAIFLSLITAIKAHASFTFTKIADTESNFSSLGFFPAINNNGTVVFWGTPTAATSGIFTSDGKQTTTIADTISNPFSLFSKNPTINDQGTVAFRANLKTIGSGIFTSSDGVTTTIAESPNPTGVFEDPEINNSGTVAFSAPAEGGRGILISQDGEETIIADTNGSSFTNFDGYALNDSNTVALSAKLNNEDSAIYINSGKENNRIVDTKGSFSFFFKPSINNVGTVAFKGILKTLPGEGIFTVKDGQTNTIVDNSSLFNFFEKPAINDTDTVAFKGVLKNGGLGIFTGSDPEKNKVIVAGDYLLGSTVTDLFFSTKGLNNANQLVFYAKLADGRSGIFRADREESVPTTSVPEPSSVLGIMMISAISTVVKFKYSKT